MDINAPDLPVVFSMLDKDGSGDLSHKEFCDGIYKMKASDEHTMLVFVLFYIVSMQQDVHKCVKLIQTDLAQHREDMQLTFAASNPGKSMPPAEDVAPAVMTAALERNVALRGNGTSELASGTNVATGAPGYVPQSCIDAGEQLLMLNVVDSIKQLSEQIDENLASLRSKLACPVGAQRSGGLLETPSTLPASKGSCGYTDSEEMPSNKMLDGSRAANAIRHKPTADLPCQHQDLTRAGPDKRIQLL